uniref:Uncharacterized protein n=1 Tax=Mustela putorius furo TaxID=9669 RepID=M3Y490_MUSPF
MLTYLLVHSFLHKRSLSSLAHGRSWISTFCLWKEPRCPSTDEWIRKMWSIYTMEYYASNRKDEYPTFVATWTGLEEIMLSEISQAESQLSYGFTYLWSITNIMVDKGC